VPVQVHVVDEDGNETGQTAMVSQDEGVRAETTPASLAKLKPAFKKDGATTAGITHLCPFCDPSFCQ
jgi:acetyl-CoA acyltransferase 1